MLCRIRADTPTRARKKMPAGEAGMRSVKSARLNSVTANAAASDELTFQGKTCSQPSKERRGWQSRPTGAHGGGEQRRSAHQAGKAKQRATGRQGNKSERVLALLRQPGGVAVDSFPGSARSRFQAGGNLLAGCGEFGRLR